MKFQTSLLCFFALLIFLCTSSQAAENTIPDAEIVESTCPPVSNVEIEYLPAGQALVHWTPIAGITQYKVRVSDASGNIVFNQIVGGPPVVISGLNAGVKYKLSICYTCPANNKEICYYKDFQYIIIDDLIVMLELNNCSCQTTPGSTGLCPTSLSPYYELLEDRVYTVTTDQGEGTTLTFVYTNGNVNPVGDCPNDFDEMDAAVHGAYNSPLPAYEFYESSVHFHGNTFCVNSDFSYNVKFCPYGAEKDRESEQVGIETLEIKPNPFSNFIQITGLNASKNGIVRLRDTAGRLIKEMNFSDTENMMINTEILTSGIYLIEAYIDGETPVVRKIVK